MAVTRARAPRALSVLAIGAVGALGLAGCTAGGTDGDASSASVLSVAASAAVTTWDPVRSFSTEALYLGNVYEPLLWKNAEGADEDSRPASPSPGRPAKTDSPGHSRSAQGATFHDGEPVDAAAVKASIEAAKDHAGASFIWAPLESIDAPDDTTVDHAPDLLRADGPRRLLHLRRLDRLAEGPRGIRRR